MKRLIKKAGKQTLYNGIAFENLKSIISNGLIPQFIDNGGAQLGGGQVGNEEKMQNYNGFTFLATSIDMAYNYAQSYYNDVDPITVVEFSVEEDKLLPDDTDCPTCKTWQESKDAIEQVKCIGKVEPENIIKIHFFDGVTGKLVFSSSVDNWEKDYKDNEDNFEW